MESEFSNFEYIQDAFSNNNNNKSDESLLDFNILSQIRTNQDKNEITETETIINNEIQNKIEVIKQVVDILGSHLNTYFETLKNNTKRLEKPRIDEKILKNIGKKTIKEIYSNNSKHNENIINNLISNKNDDNSIKKAVLIDIMHLEFRIYYSYFVSDKYLIQNSNLFYTIDTLSNLLEKIEKKEFEKLSIFERNSQIGKNKVNSILNDFKTKALELQDEINNVI